jgi:hypothetical protein
MSLKTFVNTPAMWTAYQEYIDKLITDQHKVLEQLNDVASMHRTQGAITALRSMKQLRDKLNAKQ